MGFLKVQLPTPPERFQEEGDVFSTISSPVTGDGSVIPVNYDPAIAECLCSVATWSYADLPTFQEKLSTLFPGAIFIQISVVNDALFINAYAQIIRFRNTAIVCFRGTELVNPISWMVDVQTGKETLVNIVADNTVTDDETTKSTTPSNIPIEAHGGFVRNFRQVWEGRQGILRHLQSPELMDLAFDAYNETTTTNDDTLDAIYITGHSLGGAMAFLAGLSLVADTIKGQALGDKLKGIYTFGQPMVTGRSQQQQELVGNFIGSRLFRHVYWNDIIPHLPPLSVGDFAHCGVELRAKDNHGPYSIVAKTNEITQVVVMLPTVPFAFLDFVLQNIQWTKDFVKLPWSIADHIPSNYLSAFQR